MKNGSVGFGCFGWMAAGFHCIVIVAITVRRDEVKRESNERQSERKRKITVHVAAGNHQNV